MESLSVPSVRLAAFLVVGVLLWALETRFPLFPHGANRRAHAVTNLALTALTLLMYMLLGAATAAAAVWTAANGVGFLSLTNWNPLVEGLIAIVALDLFAYFAHVSMHKIGVGWQAHQVHHSDPAVDVTTALRQHPIESLWRVTWQLAGVVIFGVALLPLVVYLTLSGINALFEHSNITLPKVVDRVLRLVWVTPDMHKWHHSRRQQETDSNYGNLLSVWDRTLGTYTPAGDLQQIRYGLDGLDSSDRQRFAGLIRLPFDPTAIAMPPMRHR